MHKKLTNKILTLLLCALFCATPAYPLAPVNKSKTSQQRNSKSSKKKTSKSQQKKKNATSSKPKTSAEATRQREKTAEEIKRTQQQIEENERTIRKNIDELGKLEQQIGKSQQEVAASTKKVNELKGKIAALQTQIDANNKRLEELRAGYLGAVKKMRLKKGSTSALAFVFASENFNQAMRRMRYLKQFSDWRTKQTDEIKKATQELDLQTQTLTRTVTEQDRALALQRKAQNELQASHAKQNEVVASLRKQGNSLRDHLARKQREANELNNTIASLIASEQAAARAEEERQRKAQEEAARKERERKAAEAAEAERLLAENKQREEQAKADRAAYEEAKKAGERKEEKRKEGKRKEEKKKKEEPKKAEPKKETTSSKTEYADARRRKPRGDSQTSVPATTKAESSNAKNAATPATSSFAAAKGKLPRPVDGKFVVVSPFGRHELPNMPGVEYDNPGIDAEVTAGSAAKAVYAGKVSGVYVMPGYQTVVIVQHGNHYTVYGNLESSAVAKGQTLTQGQMIGKVATEDGRTVLHFEVWKNHDKLNPQSWIK